MSRIYITFYPPNLCKYKFVFDIFLSLYDVYCIQWHGSATLLTTISKYLHLCILLTFLEGYSHKTFINPTVSSKGLHPQYRPQTPSASFLCRFSILLFLGQAASAFAAPPQRRRRPQRRCVSEAQPEQPRGLAWPTARNLITALSSAEPQQRRQWRHCEKRLRCDATRRHQRPW